MSERVGFIGAGQMALALASGMVESGKLKSDQVCFFEPSQPAAERFLHELPGATRLESNRELVQQASLVWLAIKPQMIDKVGSEIRGQIPEATVVVSIVAGISIKQLSDQIQTSRLIRVMPNTPALIGRGASGMASSESVPREQAEMVLDLMKSVGVCFELEERLLDVVTGLSGSGPAYVFVILDGLIEGAVRQGLPRSVARELAIQTVAGAATMMAQTKAHPAELRDRVTSPGGTTAAGLFELESMQIRAAMMRAVEGATTKAKELGNGSN